MNDQLILTASLALNKFSEGEEDWTEWKKLASAIQKECEESPVLSDFARVRGLRRCLEFWQRLDNR